MNSPLSGLKVLDLTRLIPGPFWTMILADLGAGVIKVEEPGIGDYERQVKPIKGQMAYRFMMLNRNKKSLSLNLKEEAGEKIFLNLVNRSDVVVEGFRPGVMTELGLGYDDLRKGNPVLIYCSLTSYGHTGPYKGKVAHDINILAQVGLLDLMGGAEGPPIIPGVQLADTVTALYGVIGILAACIAKGMTGRGQHIDLSMQDCAFSLMFDSIRYPLAEGRAPKRGQERLMGGLANYNIYESGDGQYIAIGALGKKFKDALFEELGLDDFIEKGPGITSSEVNPEKEEVMKRSLQEKFKQRPLEKWQKILEPANVFFSAVKTVADALEAPQLKARRMIVDAEHPLGGSYTHIGSPLKLSGTPCDLHRLVAPTLGEHTQEILKELGVSEDDLDHLHQTGVI
jgi:crotonobetainyl-CoA:carnitine CoA-transferase CaiB-like acyl-CoA transferase